MLVVTIFAMEPLPLSANPTPYSTVGQSTNREDTQGLWTRHNFWAAGRHWVWWSTASSGGYLVYATSTDGTNWTPATQVLGPGINSDSYASVWYNGSVVMYIGELPYSGNLFVFRMGTPNSDGSITWLATQQTISNSAPIYSDVKTDSNGYVWISYTTLSPMHTYAMQNQKRDGTWLNGTQYQLDQRFFYGYLPTDIVPLANGQMYFSYNSNTCATGGLYGRLWNGTAMLPQEQVMPLCPGDQGYSSGVGVGSTVFVAFGDNAGGVHFTQRLPNGTWTTDSLLQSSGNATQVSLSLNGTTSIIAFWQGGNPAKTVYYRVYTISANSWAPTVTWFTDPEGFTEVFGVANLYSRPGSFYSDFGNSSVRYIGFQYSAGNSTRFDVKYAFLSFSLQKSVTIITQIVPSVNVSK